MGVDLELDDRRGTQDLGWSLLGLSEKSHHCGGVLSEQCC